MKSDPTMCAYVHELGNIVCVLQSGLARSVSYCTLFFVSTAIHYRPPFILMNFPPLPGNIPSHRIIQYIPCQKYIVAIVGQSAKVF
jgi:hypothetical protein